MAELPEYMTPIIDSSLIMESMRYNPEEKEFIERLVLGAQALLYNAGAFSKDSPLCKIVVEFIVGFWLENRDSMNYDYKNVKSLPMSVQSMITSLQYEVKEVTTNEVI